MRGPQASGLLGPPGRPRFGPLPLRVPSRPGLRPASLTSGLPPSSVAGSARPAAARGHRLPDTSLQERLPLPASIVCRAAGGAGGGGRRQRSGGSAPRTAGSEAGKVGAVPPPGPGPGSGPARRVPAPATASPARTYPQPPPPASGRGRWPPRRRQRVRRCLATPPCPLPAAARLPRETDVVPAGLGCGPAAGTPPSVPSAPGHAPRPPGQPLPSPAPAPDRPGEDGDGGGTELWPPLRRGSPGGAPDSVDANEDVPGVGASTDTRNGERRSSPEAPRPQVLASFPHLPVLSRPVAAQSLTACSWVRQGGGRPVLETGALGVDASRAAQSPGRGRN